jgi:hypothetical protein
MSPIGHLGVGLAAKRFVPKVPLVVLLFASWVIDILFFIFMFAGIENMNYDPWSHSLFMSVIWSLAAALLAWIIYRNERISIVIGLLVFSHWVLDFISWSTLPLFFGESPQVGLGLYDSVLFKLPFGNGIVIAVELLGFFIPGLLLYITYIVKKRREMNNKIITS